jgi:hypothetical protein
MKTDLLNCRELSDAELDLVQGGERSGAVAALGGLYIAAFFMPCPPAMFGLVTTEMVIFGLAAAGRL